MFWHRSGDSEKAEDSQYQEDGVFGKEHRVQKAVGSLQRLLDTVRDTVNSLRQGSPNFTKHVRTDDMDGFGGFLCEFLREAQKLIKT